MDLAGHKFGFPADLGEAGDGSGPAGAALTADIVRGLLQSPETSRAVLGAALHESARQFESLLSCVDGTFYRSELSPPWRMEFVSPGIAEISGYGPEAFRDMPFGDLIEPEDRPALERDIAEAIARRERFTACYRIRHRSGDIRWVSERGAAVYDAAGSALFIEGFIAEVTTAKRLELEAETARREIERLHGRMERILECTLEGILSFDSDWNYRFANRTAVEDTIPAADLLGRNIKDVFPDVCETEAWPAMVHAMTEREAVRAECFTPRNGKWYELYAVPDADGITAFFRNITDRKRLEQELVKQAEELRNTLDTIPDMVWTADPGGKGKFYNKAFNDFLGGASEPAIGDERPATWNWVHPDDRDRCLGAWYEAMRGTQPFEQEVRMRHHSGEYRWLIARAWPHCDDTGRVLKWCGAATDIHKRILAERELRDSRTLQTNLLDASTDSIAIGDLDGKLIFVNAAGLLLGEATGTSPKSLIGRQWIDFWPAERRPAARRAFRRAQRGRAARYNECFQALTGELVWWDVVISPIRDADGEVRNVLCVARDVTEQRLIAEQLRVASEQDVLTRLPNRRAFEAHLNEATAGASESGTNVGLMLIDLDHFKHVNDTLGHLAGDHLLQVFARRLEECVGATGFVARLGGDEFAIVLRDVREESELVDAAAKILYRMEEPVTFAGQLINGGLSIGCGMFPRDARDAQTLLRHTDTALYDLKTGGRGGIQMFNRRMMEAAERTANQLHLARTAIRDDAVEPYYQPKVRLDSCEIAGFEALLRWWSPGKGIQPPGLVAEAFNNYELSTKIGALMQSRVFADMARWLGAGLCLPPVSINAAPAEFLRDDYAERVLDRLDEFGIPSALLEIEITEHVFLERRSEHVVRALEMLKQAGVRIALDDFGTGHSSLSHLRDFPVDVLKIDRSFVSRMLTKPRMLAIVQAITTLGPSLSLDIVAEGVETPEQLHALRDAGCEFGQGYLFGKAMNADEIVRRMTTGNWPFRLAPL